MVTIQIITEEQYYVSQFPLTTGYAISLENQYHLQFKPQCEICAYSTQFTSKPTCHLKPSLSTQEKGEKQKQEKKERSVLNLETTQQLYTALSASVTKCY